MVNTTAAEVKGGEAITLAVSKLDLTSLGSPVNTSLARRVHGCQLHLTALGAVPVSAGAATV